MFFHSRTFRKIAHILTLHFCAHYVSWHINITDSMTHDCNQHTNRSVTDVAETQGSICVMNKYKIFDALFLRNRINNCILLIHVRAQHIHTDTCEIPLNRFILRHIKKQRSKINWYLVRIHVSSWYLMNGFSLNVEAISRFWVDFLLKASTKGLICLCMTGFIEIYLYSHSQ